MLLTSTEHLLATEGLRCPGDQSIRKCLETGNLWHGPQQTLRPGTGLGDGRVISRALAASEPGGIEPGGLATVAIDRGEDTGGYWEPYVWMEHTI
jgi:hypothetical protein